MKQTNLGQLLLSLQYTDLIFNSEIINLKFEITMPYDNQLKIVNN